MSTVTAKQREWIEAQGYLGLSDAELAEIGPWIRLAPAMCMTWTAAATLSASALWLWALVPFAVLGAIMPGHPFEVIYNHGLRHLRGRAHLPPAGAPRRFACALGATWLGATGWAFFSAVTTLGYALGALMALSAAVPTFTGFCIPSFIWGRIFGSPAAAG